MVYGTFMLNGYHLYCYLRVMVFRNMLLNSGFSIWEKPFTINGGRLGFHSD